MADAVFIVTNFENNGKGPYSLQPYLPGVLVSKSVESDQKSNQRKSDVFSHKLQLKLIWVDLKMNPG